MKNQIFDWSRFVLALRKEVVENGRQLLLALLVTYGTLTMLMILGNWMSGGDESPEAIHLRYIFVFAAAGLASSAMASLAFRGLMTKAGRVELLTSPSSMTEKFAVNVVVYALGYLAAFLLATQLADLTRVAVLWFARSDSFQVPGPINFMCTLQHVGTGFNPKMANSTLFTVSLYLSLLANPGLYMLGSALWPRISFLKTCAAVYVIEAVVMLVGIFVIRGMGSFEDFAMRIMDSIENGGFAIFMLVIVVLQLVLYWVLAWVVFHRKDVISKGMFH
ncbi:MAG: hypothetical protein IJ775_06910 [Muribaculaceae bacterium]|nr:hypothetical protein [Muribaculaceae bacterium]